MMMDQTAAPPAFQSRSIAALPGPRGLPVFGNVLALQPKKLHLILERWAERYGSTYSLRMFDRRVVVTTDRSAIAVALRRRPDIFRRMAVMQDVLQEMSVDGVFSAEGETWRVQRRAVAQALDAAHVRNFFPTLRSVTERLKRRWDVAAQAGTPIDVLSELSLYTVDVTTNFAFGYDMNTLEHGGDLMQDHLARVFPMINRRINLPFPYWRYFKLPVDRAFDRSVSYVRERVREMIEATRRRLALSRDGEVRPNNFMEAMLADEADGKARLSPDLVYANAMTILVAGEDTTASALAWSLHLIASHPEVQARLQAEADLVLGGDRVLADLGDVGQLVYHDAVISESLRLKPVAPLLFLEANVATEIAGVSVPAGTPVFLVTRPHALSREGAKAHDFVPDHWLDGSGRRGGDFAFGAGPRLCPGRNLALVELMVALSMIVKNFSLVSPPNPADVYEEFSFAMVPRNLRLRLCKRESNRPDG